MAKKGFNRVKNYYSDDIIELRVKNSNRVIYKFECKITDKKAWNSIIQTLYKIGWDLRVLEIQKKEEEGWIS